MATLKFILMISGSSPSSLKKLFFGGHSGSQITHVVIRDRDPDFIRCVGTAAKPKKHKQQTTGALNETGRKCWSAAGFI